MNKRSRKKRFKKDIQSYVKMGVCVQDCNKCKQDSIAHEIKHHFEREYVQNLLLFKYDINTNKMLVSKKQLNHLIRLCNTMEIRNDYDFEFVEEIKL